MIENGLRAAALVMVVILASMLSGMIRIVKQQHKEQRNVVERIGIFAEQEDEIERLERVNEILVDGLKDIAVTYRLHSVVTDILMRSNKYSK